MAVKADVAAPTPGWEAYTGDPETAGPFENQILYAMCRDNPAHGDPYVTAGKITAIGRIYAAAPERGAGSGREPGSLSHAIAVRLANSPLDERLDAIAFADRFSELNRARVVEAQRLLVDEVARATRGWSISGDDGDWSPRNQASLEISPLPQTQRVSDHGFVREGGARLCRPEGPVRHVRAVLR